MDELLNNLEYIRAYIDDLLIISNSNYEDILNKLQNILKKLKAAGFKINADKLFFAIDDIEYVYFRIIRHGIMPNLITYKQLNTLL